MGSVTGVLFPLVVTLDDIAKVAIDFVCVSVNAADKDAAEVDLGSVLVDAVEKVKEAVDFVCVLFEVLGKAVLHWFSQLIETSSL